MEIYSAGEIAKVYNCVYCESRMKKKGTLHLFGIFSVLIIADFWVRYFVFCRFDTISPFNALVHRWPLAGSGLLLLLFLSIVVPLIAAFTNKLWLLMSLVAFGTLTFFFSQIT